MFLDGMCCKSSKKIFLCVTNSHRDLESLSWISNGPSLFYFDAGTRMRMILPTKAHCVFTCAAQSMPGLNLELSWSPFPTIILLPFYSASFRKSTKKFVLCDHIQECRFKSTLSCILGLKTSFGFPLHFNVQKIHKCDEKKICLSVRDFRNSRFFHFWAPISLGMLPVISTSFLGYACTWCVLYIGMCYKGIACANLVL